MDLAKRMKKPDVLKLLFPYFPQSGTVPNTPAVTPVSHSPAVHIELKNLARTSSKTLSVENQQQDEENENNNNDENVNGENEQQTETQTKTKSKKGNTKRGKKTKWKCDVWKIKKNF